MRFPLRLCVVTAIFALSACVLSAGEKKLMHCFYFSPVAEATQADWDAFAKATDSLPGKIPGLTRVWHGKLNRNMAIFTPDAETSKKLRAGEKAATGSVSVIQRQYGVCMEMDSADALKAYAAHPVHKEWDAVYQKVRQYGTTTVDILGQ